MRIGKFENALGQQSFHLAARGNCPGSSALRRGSPAPVWPPFGNIFDAASSGDDPVQQLDQLRLCNSPGVSPKGLRIGDAAGSAQNCARWGSRLVRFLILGLAPDFGNALRQVEAGDLGEGPNASPGTAECGWRERPTPRTSLPDRFKKARAA